MRIWRLSVYVVYIGMHVRHSGCQLAGVQVRRSPPDPTKFSFTVFLAKRNKLYTKIIFSYANKPTISKFDADSKTGLKQFHAISEGHFFVIGISREMTKQFFEIVL